MYQDNHSAMRIDIYGRNVCTGNSRHINVRYFFIKYQVDSGDIKIEYFPTLMMIADYFTKPLMGDRFRDFRRIIMGHKSISEMDPRYLQPIKERVEI